MDAEEVGGAFHNVVAIASSTITMGETLARGRGYGAQSGRGGWHSDSYGHNSPHHAQYGH